MSDPQPNRAAWFFVCTILLAWVLMVCFGLVLRYEMDKADRWEALYVECAENKWGEGGG